MPKKKKKSTIRRSKMRAAARGQWGYYLFRESGVSVAYVAKANEDGSVEAALFGMDTWRDGLIVCHGHRFEDKETFENAAPERSKSIKPSTKIICREEIASGERIRLTSETDLPISFEQWRHLVDPLADVKLPIYLYRCPECNRGVPKDIYEMVLDGVDGDVSFYMVCDRCSHSKSKRKTPMHATIKHNEVIDAIEEMEEFSFTWEQDYLPDLTRVPVSQNLPEVMEMMIAAGDVEKATTMVIETYIASVAVPSPIVEDRHVLAALELVMQGKPVASVEGDNSEPVLLLAYAIEDGIQMFSNPVRLRRQATPRVRSALEWILESVHNHHSASNPRSYIQFINRFVPV